MLQVVRPSDLRILVMRGKLSGNIEDQETGLRITETT